MWIEVILAVWLLGISALDICRRSVPLWTLAPGGVLAVLAVACHSEGGGIDFFVLLEGILPGVLLLLLAFFTKNAGSGDGIVLLFLGAAEGGGKGLALFGVSLFLISIFSIVLLIIKKAGKNTKIPYLPFLTAAWLLIMLEL